VSNAQIGDDLVSVDLRSLADDVWAGLNTENAELSVEPNLSFERPVLLSKTFSGKRSVTA